MTTHTLSEAAKKLLPHAEAEQENLYYMAKQNPDEYQTGYEDCRHAVSYAYEALREHAETKAVSIGRQLPSDPEGMNDNRADWAGHAISAFQIQTGTDFDDALKDLLCDLMHWCDRTTFEDGETKIDFDAALASARMHYEAETAPEIATG
jgi:hypothetical protein